MVHSLARGSKGPLHTDPRLQVREELDYLALSAKFGCRMDAEPNNPLAYARERNPIGKDANSFQLRL